MNNPGIKSLGDISIAAAGTVVGDWVDDLEGMLSATIQIRLAYGSGGGTINVYLQTSLDQGVTPIDIACFSFVTASDVKVRNLSVSDSELYDVTPTDGALAEDSSVDNILGDRFRLKIVSTGTYATSTIISGRACVR